WAQATYPCPQPAARSTRPAR
ncbi:hypothetical protein, partial [Roseomonas mucosa]